LFLTERLVDGFVWHWFANFVYGSTFSRCRVHYTLDLKEKDGLVRFIYFLRTGAMWDGPIGKEVVEVDIQKGLKVNIVSPTGYKPKTQTDEEIVWELVNAKPTEDIQLKIESASK
jgi:hypothetical protein